MRRAEGEKDEFLIDIEHSIIELGRKSLLGKAKARPDLVKRFMIYG